MPMQIGLSLLKSILFRRFVILFLVCVLLPLSILGGYSYQRVEKQLYEQSMLRLDKDCKVYGMALVDRLVHIKNLTEIFGSYLMAGQSPDSAFHALKDQLNQGVTGIGIYRADFGVKTFSGSLELIPDSGLIGHALNNYDKTTIYSEKNSAGLSTIYLLVPYVSDGRQGLLIAQTESSALWGVGVTAMLPAMTELAVYDENSQLITSTQMDPGQSLPPVSKLSTSGNYMHFQYEAEGDTYFASGWPMFLKSQFNARTWTIVLSITRTNMLSSVLKFKRTFPLVIILTLWSTLFLSFFFIRRTLTPLAALQQGTERIGRKDFTNRVDITSGDEFEQLAESFNNMSGQLNRQFTTLALIDEIDRSILSSLDASIIIPRAMRMIAEFFVVQVSILAERSPGDSRRLHLTILQRNKQNDLTEEYVELTNQEYGKIIVEEPYVLCPRASLPSIFHEKSTSEYLLVLPLESERYSIGALILDFTVLGKEDVEERIRQARQLADQLGIALSHARLVADLERLSLGTVEALARTVDAKSKWTAGHSERVSELAVKIAAAMNWNDERLEILSRGGLLHDIGKIGVPIALLDKSETLTDEEYEAIKMHPAIGGKILEPIQVYKDIMPLVTQHHERFDGTGYPLGLAGEAIDIGARILCVADVYDALISQRPYREGWVKNTVIMFMRENRGGIFDPEIIDVFLSLDI